MPPEQASASPGATGRLEAAPTGSQLFASSLFATELASPFSAPSKALADLLRTTQPRSNQGRERGGRHAGIVRETPPLPKSPFAPVAGPAVGLSAPAPAPLSSAGSASSSQSEALRGTVGSWRPPAASAAPAVPSSPLPLLRHLVPTLRPTTMKGRTLQQSLELLAYCSAPERPRLVNSPLMTFGALKLLQFTDEHHASLADLGDAELRGVLEGLGLVCRLGITFSATALVCLADLVERHGRAAVVFHRLLADVYPTFLHETTLFTLLAYLKPCVLRQRLVAFCAKLVQWGVVAQPYLMACVREAHLRQLEAEAQQRPRLTGRDPGLPSTTSLLNNHWISRLNVKFQASVEPAKGITLGRDASLHAAMFESEATYLEDPEMAYPPFLFSPAYPPPPSTTLLQAHIFYDATLGAASMAFQQYQLEVEVLCSHSAVDHTDDSLLYVFGQHYFPASPTTAPANLPEAGKVQHPKLHILRARQDVKFVVAKRAGLSIPDTVSDVQPAVPWPADLLLSDVAQDVSFMLRYRRKIVVPFFLSKRYPAFLFTLQVNHRNRFADVFDDLCDPDDADVFGGATPPPLRVPTAPAASSSTRPLSRSGRGSAPRMKPGTSPIQVALAQVKAMGKASDSEEDEVDLPYPVAPQGRQRRTMPDITQ
eukprot:EG_transcript_5851